MKRNRIVKQTVNTFLFTALVGIACAGMIIATATSASARDKEEKPHRHVVAQAERPPVPQPPAPQPPAPQPPAPAPATRQPVRAPNTRPDNRPEPTDVSLDIEIRI